MPQLENLEDVVRTTSRMAQGTDFDPIPDPFGDLSSIELDEFGIGEVEPWWWDEDPFDAPLPQGFDANRWMNDYENGQIPFPSLTRIGGGNRTDYYPGGGFYLRPDAASAFLAMKRQAAKAGVGIELASAYRPLAHQRELFSENPWNGNSGAAEPGQSNHGWGLAVDVRNEAAIVWMAENAQKFGFAQHPASGERHHFTYQGGYEGATRPAKGRRVKLPAMEEPITTLGILRGDEPWTGTALPAAVASILTPDPPRYAPAMARGRKTPTGTPSSRKGVKGQLYEGFMDAGRPDLAKMVYTKAFETWINGESGWDVDNVSRLYTTSGGTFVNGGLFQIRYVHEWARPYFSGGNDPSGRFTPTAYDQARLIARYFSHLTPAAIYRYAEQMDSGGYKGWG